jgi:hypothetical protein
MDCIETAGFPGQAPEEVERLLHMVVVVCICMGCKGQGGLNKTTNSISMIIRVGVLPVSNTPLNCTTF